MFHVLLGIALILFILVLILYIFGYMYSFWGDFFDAWEERFFRCPGCRAKDREIRRGKKRKDKLPWCRKLYHWIKAHSGTSKE